MSVSKSKTVDSGGGEELNAWSSTKTLTAYQEARKMLNAQQKRRQHLDDKALRTGRLATVVATISVSLIGGLSLQVRPLFGLAGGALLVVAFGFSITSYTASPLFLGPNGRYLNDMALDATTQDLVLGANTDTDQWELSLILVMGTWIDDNSKILATGKRRLVVSEILLFAGVVSLLLGVVL